MKLESLQPNETTKEATQATSDSTTNFHPVISSESSEV